MEVNCLLEIYTSLKILYSANWSKASDNWIVVAGSENQALILDAHSGEVNCTLVGHSDTLKAALFSEDDTKVFTTGVD